MICLHLNQLQYEVILDLFTAQAEGRYQDSMEKAKNALKLVENSSDEDIQNKPELIASLNSSLGNAYLELGKLHQAMDYHQRDLDIAREK